MEKRSPVLGAKARDGDAAGRMLPRGNQDARGATEGGGDGGDDEGRREEKDRGEYRGQGRAGVAESLPEGKVEKVRGAEVQRVS